MAATVTHPRPTDNEANTSTKVDRPKVPNHKGIVRAFAWTGIGTWSVQLLTWASTIIVARLLSPSDYGLVGMASIYLGIAALVSEFGLGTAVVTLRDLSEEQIGGLNTLSIILGGLLFLLTCAIAGPLAEFFKAPNLRLVTIAMGATFITTSFKVIPDGLLQKAQRFKLLAYINVLQTAVTAVVTVAAAWAGAGYWALVLGGVLGPTFGSLLSIFFCRVRFSWPKFQSLRSSLFLSWNLVVSRLAWYFYSNADFLVAGKVLGQAALGSYTLAWNIASLPVQKITNLVTRVMPSYFSAAQTDVSVLRRYFLVLTEGLLLLTLPASLGLCAISDQVVAVVFGSKWSAAALPLALLAVYISVRSVTTLYAPLLIAKGRVMVTTWANVAAALIFPVAFYLGSRWGTAGIAAMWPLLYWIVVIPMYRDAARVLDLPLRDYLHCAVPAIRASALMLLAVLALRYFLPSSEPLAMRLLAEVTAGILAYMAMIAKFDRVRLLQLCRSGR